MFEPLTQRLQRLSEDERAVSPVVGFVLIFALIMLVFTIYQADVVPAQNEEAEFKHSQTVEKQMSQLNDAMTAVSATGASRSRTIATGMQYPSRALAINPGPPAGSLRLGQKNTIDLGEVSVDGSGYWDEADDGSGEPAFESKPVVYTVNYNNQQNDPRFTIRNGQLFRQYGGSEALSDGGQAGDPIPDKQIDLVLVDGDISRSGQSTSVTTSEVSSSAGYLTATTHGDTVLTFPTTLTQSEAQSTFNGKSYATLEGYNSRSDKPNTIDVTLTSGEQFRFRITKVSLGSDGNAPAHEVVPTEDTIAPDTPTATLNATVNESVSFSVLVRDKYGNPVPGVEVEANNGTNVVPDSTTTDDDGEATFSYTPTASANRTVNITAGEVTSAYDTASYDVTVEEGEETVSTDNSSVVKTGCAASGNASLTVENTYSHPVEVSISTRSGSPFTLPPDSKTTYTVGGGAMSYQITNNTDLIASGNLDCSG